MHSSILLPSICLNRGTTSGSDFWVLFYCYFVPISELKQMYKLDQEMQKEEYASHRTAVMHKEQQVATSMKECGNKD